MNDVVRETVERALAEDIGPGDLTSQACVPADKKATGRFVARERIRRIEPEVAFETEIRAAAQPLGVDTDVRVEIAAEAADGEHEAIVAERVDEVVGVGDGGCSESERCERDGSNHVHRVSVYGSVEIERR